MGLGCVLFLLLCVSQVQSSLAKKMGKETSEVKSGTEHRDPAKEQETDWEKILLRHLEVTAPTPKIHLQTLKTGSGLTFNLTIFSVSHNEKEDEKEDSEELEKEEDNIVEDAIPTTVQPTTTTPVDDNFSYFLYRLSSIESAIHRLNVQFHGMDIKMNQMSQSFSKMRTKLGEAEDTIATVSEMNLRNQKHIGQIEGCLKGRRFLRKCYLLFQQFENYATAQNLCQSRGGNLAMPVDQQDFAALSQYVRDAFFPFNWPIWIGINDLRSEGLYLYENGHRVSFFNWYKDHLVTQPNGKTHENCVSITSDDGKWWDNECSRRMYFVCEY
ncbi:C-type lectin domain family 11 member A [Discoglossus pictus]